jgi:AcrR family transcriptional regulator
MEFSERQQDIIEKALELIATGGIQNLTIKNLAGAIGVSEPALYRHFVNKYAILDAILESFKDTASEVLEEESKYKKSSLEKIENFIMDRYRRAVSNPNMAKVMFSEEIFQDDKRLAAKVLDIMHSHKDKMHKIIVEGQEKGEIRDDFDTLALFRIIFGPVRLLIKQWCLSGNKFDLVKEGGELWNVARTMIQSEHSSD